MSLKSPKVLWYFRISRLFGVFPVRILTDGTVRFSPWSVFNLLPFGFSLSYTVLLSHFLYSMLKLEWHHLSYVLTIFPNTITTVLTDGLIRISSIWYCNDLIKFISLTAEVKGQRPERFMAHFRIVPALYFIFALFRVSSQVIIANQSGIQVTAVGTATGMHPLAAFALSPCEFLHDAAIAFALFFLIIFGKRALSTFCVLCDEILRFCRVQANTVAYNVALLPTPCKVETVISLYVQAEQLAEKFLRLKTAFGIYSKIGGLFAFALVGDIGTFLYYLACTVMFNNESASTPFVFAMMAIQSLMHVLVLVTIAELGHQMDCQVTSRQTE